jgi:MFS transporter, PHS family, inorganic phosphate transporter
MTVFMLGLSPSRTTPENHVGIIVMYAFTFFFANFGPNSTTLIVPARLCCPCAIASHKLAVGKAGAIVGSLGFLYASQLRGRSILGAGQDAGYPRPACTIRCSCSPAAMPSGFPVPQSRGRSLEELSSEKGVEAASPDKQQAMPVEQFGSSIHS